MYGAQWCADCRRTKRQLDELAIDYTYLDVERDPDAEARAVAISGRQSIPVVVFPDGSHLVEPSSSGLLAHLHTLGLLAA